MASPVIECLTFVFEFILRSIWKLLQALYWTVYYAIRIALDTIAMAFGAVAAVSGVRTCQMMQICSEDSDHDGTFCLDVALSMMDEWSAYSCANFLFMLGDIPTYLAMLIVYVTVWRAPQLHRTVWKVYRPDGREYSTKWRGEVWYIFWLWFLDVFVIPFAVVVLFLVYRAPRLLRKLRHTTNDYEARARVVIEFFHILVDIPCIVVGVAMMCTWRLPWFVLRVYKVYFGEVFDSRRLGRTGDVGADQYVMRAIPWIELWTLLTSDLPAIIATPFCLLPWRAKLLSLNIRGDIDDASDWQTPASWTLDSSYSFWREVSVSFVQAGTLGFLDLIASIGALVVLVTWRGPILLFRLCASYDNRKGNAPVIGPITAKSAAEDRVVTSFRMYQTVGWEILLIFADIPAIFCAVVSCATVYRAPLMIFKLRSITTTMGDSNPMQPGEWSLHARQVCMQQGALVFADLLLVVPFLCAAVSWRSFQMMGQLQHAAEHWQNLRKTQPRGKATLYALGRVDFLVGNPWCILKQFCLLFVDVVLGVCVLVILVTLWRAAPLLKALQKKLGKRRETSARLGKQTSTANILCIGWKVVMMNFGMLLLDIVAVPLFLVLVVTVWRLPAFVSGLAATGNIRKFFAGLVFLEFFHLLVDIPAMLWFLIMLILRPMGSVVILLEDRRHKRRRLLMERNGEIQDLIANKNQVIQNLDDTLSQCLKEGIVPPGMRHGPDRRHGTYGDGSRLQGEKDYFVPYPQLTRVMNEYLEKFRIHKEKTQEYRDKRYNYLLEQVIRIESARARLLARRAHAEFSYQTRPDAAVRTANLALFKREMSDFSTLSQKAFEDLKSYVPPEVPLWSKRTGLSQRTRRETHRALLEILTTGYFAELIMCLVVTIFLYRLPSMIRQVRAHWWKRRSVLAQVLLEYVKDLAAVVCMILVTAGLYRSLELYNDVAVAILERKSWAQARTASFTHFRSLGSDLLELLWLPLRWMSYVFVALALMWGVLVPIDLFNPIAGTLLAVLLWFVFTSFPFAFSFYFVDEVSPSDIDWCIFGFGLALVCTLLLSLRSISQEGLLFQPPREYQFFRLNWENLDTIVAEVVDFVQISCLILSIGIPMKWGDEIEDGAEYGLFNFIPSDVKFWLLVVITLVWYLVASAPPVLEDVMKSWTKFSEGSVSKRLLWQLGMYFFCNTLLITVAEACIETVACTYSNEAQFGRLREDSSIECWTGEHRVAASFALFILMWYVTTTVLYVAKYGVSSDRVDIQFSALYITLNNLIKLIMVLVGVLLGSRGDKVAPALLLLGLNLLGLTVVVFFHRCVGYTMANTTKAYLYKVGAYSATTFLALAGLVGVLLDDQNSIAPIFIWFSSWGILFAVGIVVVLQRRTSLSTEAHARTEFRKRLLEFEDDVLRNGQVLSSYAKSRKALHWKIRHARVPHKLSRAEYEQGAHRLLISSSAFLGLPLEPRIGRGRFGGAVQQPPSTNDMTTDNRGGVLSIATSAMTSMFDRLSGSNPAHHTAVPEDLDAERIPSVRTDSYTSAVEVYIEPPDSRDTGVPPQYSASDASVAMEGGSNNTISADATRLTASGDVDLNRIDLLEPLGLPDGASGYSVSNHVEPPIDQFDGQTALLMLEHYLRYDALSLVFLSRVREWRVAVSQANWAGLVACFEELSNHVTTSSGGIPYEDPSQLELGAVITDTMQNDAEELILAPFVDPSSLPPDVAGARARRQMHILIEKFTAWHVDERIALLLEHLIPSDQIDMVTYPTHEPRNDTALPGYGSVSPPAFDDTRPGTKRTVVIDFVDDVHGSITEVDAGSGGYKKAVGGHLMFPDRLELTLFEGLPQSPSKTVSFGKGQLQGGKGPISVSIVSVEINQEEITATFQSAFGRKSKNVPLARTLATIKCVAWS